MKRLDEFYKGEAGYRHKDPMAMLPPVLPRHESSKYLPEHGLIRAVNVAFLMGQPLLVTGPPGCGKTALAYSIANEHGMEVHKVSVRSSTTLEDLFYEFDHLARFRDSQAGGERPLASYLRFVGLGVAILKAGGPDAGVEVHEGGALMQAEGSTSRSVGSVGGASGGSKGSGRGMVFRDLVMAEFPVKKPTASVVLVDEIDKAPRDTPNDMLGWLETMSFYVKELGITIRLPGNGRKSEEIEGGGYVAPFVVFTSNSEKSLPEPFLRRCVYFDINSPGSEKLIQIVSNRVGEKLDGSVFAQDAVSILRDLERVDSGIKRKPGVAEFLGWLVMLKERCGLKKGTRIRDRREILKDSLAVLLKTPEDVEAGVRVLGLE